MTSTALALNQEKRRVVARALLRQHGLTEWVEDYDAFGLRRHQDAAAFWQKPRIIDLIAAARGRNMPTTCAHHFDVIVDEAHHLRDRTSRSWQLSFRQTRSIVFMPPIYDWSTSGTAIVPSACWLHCIVLVCPTVGNRAVRATGEAELQIRRDWRPQGDGRHHLAGRTLALQGLCRWHRGTRCSRRGYRVNFSASYDGC